MAIDEADRSGDGDFSEAERSASPSRDHSSGLTSGSDCQVGAYSWADFMEEYGYGEEVDSLYPEDTTPTSDQLGLEVDEGGPTVPSGTDWEQVSFDPASYLGFHPDSLEDVITEVCAPNAKYLHNKFLKFLDPATTPVVKDVYLWMHFRKEYGDVDATELLGFDPATIEQQLNNAGSMAMELDELIDKRTVNVKEDFDEDEFFSTADGHTTVTNRYDLEKAVTFKKKEYFREEERYWVNKPYAFAIIFHSEKENEKKYYIIEPYLTEIEAEVQEFLSGKLRTAIKYSDDNIKLQLEEDGRREVIEQETRRLLKRYDLFKKKSGDKPGFLDSIRELLDDDPDETPKAKDELTQLEGIASRPEPVLLAEDSDILSEYQVEKVLYQLKRNFIGYERIDGIKHDINVEDISCDGYNSPVFVYHSGYEQIISNIYHGETELDDFVVKLAQRSGKGISKRMPQVDATLPDGSRAQLTLGKEVSDHGTNYTIRQFKDVPFTPIDLINWNTFSLDEMAFLWLAIENHKSLIFAGGTASGKTTSLNAVSLFIPSNTKIVSIEDTREVELPQRNWIASVTRPSFSDDSQGDVDEFDLLEAALRQRPDYIVMGEIRGEEGRTLFQVMSTGHTTYTTFHADSVDEVLKRFTTDPINVSKTMFTALDLVSIQTQTRVQGTKVRRNKSLTEINHYEAEHDEINVQDVYQWQAETDEYLKMGDSNTLDAIQFDRGWSTERLEDELFERQVILAYLIKNGLNTYAEVAATIQAFINDPETILTLIANGQLEDSLEDLRQMESVLINVDPEKEELVPRPDATNETYNLSMDLLERAEEGLFEKYRGKSAGGLGSALSDIEEPEPITVGSSDAEEFTFGGTLEEDGSDAWDFGETDDIEGTPSWLDDTGDGGFEVGSETTSSASAGGADTAAKPQSGSQPTNQADATPSPTTADEQPQLELSTDTDSTESDLPALESTETSDGTEAETESTQQATDSDSEEKIEFPELEAKTDPIPEESLSQSANQSADDEMGGLFDDMDRALDSVESPEEGAGPVDPDALEGPDTTEFDSLFPDRDLESIFGTDEPAQGTPSERSSALDAESATQDDDTGSDSIFGTESNSVFSDDTEESSSPFTGPDKPAWDDSTETDAETERDTSDEEEST